MDDLISRQAAIEIVKRYNKSHMLLKHQPMLGAVSIIIELNDLPSAQPLIRCQDCKHHHYEKDIPYCDRIDYGYGWKDSDFCSRAERREC